MEIKTVELAEFGGFIVNRDTEQMGVPDDMANRHRVMIQEWIDAGNTPTPFGGATDMELWKEKMAMSDGPLPRWAEDLINLTDGAISPQAQKLADDKKALRATKP